jgi:endonuclease/exonuclease/phosphatase family metal-dependent hydrolase
LLLSIMVDSAMLLKSQSSLIYMPKSIFRRFTKKFFITVNVIVALLFLTGCYVKWFNPATWWFLGFLNLGAFYLLVVLLLFVVFWLFAKPRWALISITAQLLAWQPLRQLLPLRMGGEGFALAKKEGNLRIMSWNVEHFDILGHKTRPESKQLMLSLIKSYAPDVACLQEMVGADTNARAINYIPDILQRTGLEQYHYSWNPKLDFDPQHHFGIIILSRYPIINKQTVSFPPNDYNSIFQYVDIVKESDTIRVFNIHLQSLKFSSNDLRYINDPSLGDKDAVKESKSIIGKLKKGFVKRGTQADRIRAEIDKSPYPVVVCGDFNDLPNSYAYATIGQGLNNAFAEKGSGLGRTFSGISPTLRIDNIFTDKKMEVVQYGRIAKKLSDHFPILADVKMLSKK